VAQEDCFCRGGTIDHEHGDFSELDLENVTVLMRPFAVLLRSIGFDIKDVSDKG
jgi:hypothetical protein